MPTMRLRTARPARGAAVGCCFSAAPARPGQVSRRRSGARPNCPLAIVGCPTPRSTLFAIPPLQGTRSRCRPVPDPLGRSGADPAEQPSRPRAILPTSGVRSTRSSSEAAALPGWTSPPSSQRAPGWANGGRSPIWAPKNPKDFADFLFAASKRYPTIRRWMIWGEPSAGRKLPANEAERPERGPADLREASSTPPMPR